MQNQKLQSWHHQIQMLKNSRVEWQPQTGKRMNMKVSLPGVGNQDRLPVSFPIWKPIITGIPIWMRWSTSASFVNILAPKCNPVPRMNASANPRTKPICNIIVCHIYKIHVLWKMNISFIILQHLHNSGCGCRCPIEVLISKCTSKNSLKPTW